jgi:hypothetical protein
VGSKYTAWAMNWARRNGHTQVVEYIQGTCIFLIKN